MLCIDELELAQTYFIQFYDIDIGLSNVPVLTMDNNVCSSHKVVDISFYFNK